MYLLLDYIFTTDQIRNIKQLLSKVRGKMTEYFILP
jgi:hypothetical protein